MRSNDLTYTSLTRATANLVVSVSGEQKCVKGGPPAIDIDYNKGTSKSDNERDAARMVGK
jgi:hypothetical protein